MTPEVSVTGPGLEVHGVIVPDGIRRTAPELWVPSADALYQVGLRLPAMSCEEWLTLEPLYLRPSSAEEQAAKQPVKQ